MLAYKNRFHNRGRIKYVSAHGTNIRGQNLSLVVLETPHPKVDSRFAIVVSKKTLKSAVGRNRIRRRIYEVIRLSLPKFKAKADVIVRVHDPSVADTPHKDLVAEAESLLKKAGLL